MDPMDYIKENETSVRDFLADKYRGNPLAFTLEEALTVPMYALVYATAHIETISQDDLKAIEAAVAKCPRAAACYAISILGTRWLSEEDIIASDSIAAYQYARDLIEGRFEKGEPAIATNDQERQYFFNISTNMPSEASWKKMASFNTPKEAANFIESVLEGKVSFG